MNARPPPGHSPLVALMPQADLDGQAIEITRSDDLVARCREGEDDAWRQLFDLHFEFVRRLAHRLGTPEAELDDVCQESFLVVFRKLDSFTHGKFTTWLYRIVANGVAYRHRRRRFRRTLLELVGRELPEEPEESQPPDAAVERRQAQRMVSQVLEKMAPKKREVFALYELEQLSGEEIAERLGCPMETVRTRLHYARKDFARLSRKVTP